MKYGRGLNQSGFTLIEIIVTIVLISILCTSILTLISDSLVKSSDPIGRIKKTLELHKIMANITADYNRYPQWKISTNYCASGSDIVIPSNVNGYCYICTQAGQSGTVEPVWPQMPATPVNDNTTAWVICSNPPYAFCLPGGRTHDLNSLGNLRAKIGLAGAQTNDYGSYYVMESKYIKFDASRNEIDDTSGANIILKVTIRNDIGETLTTLFMADNQI